jgi:hypothetical protein
MIITRSLYHHNALTKRRQATAAPRRFQATEILKSTRRFQDFCRLKSRCALRVEDFITLHHRRLVGESPTSRAAGANGGYKTQGGRSVQPSTLGPAQLRMAQRTQSHTEIVPLLSHAASPAQKLQNSVPITTSVSRYRVSEGESGVSARCRAAAAAAACI